MNEILNTNTGLQLCDNDIELYRDLLNYYLTDNHFDVKDFENQIMKSKIDGASYIHRIKGASRQIGANAVSQIGQQIEDILKDKAQGNLAPLINEFCKVYDKTITEVKKFLSSDN